MKVLREVSLSELEQMVSNAREEIWNSSDHVPRIYLHWTAGKYDSKFSDYHINITGDGRIFVSVENMATVLNHTWKRNTGSIGIVLCCAYGAGSASLGDYPPTKKQIEVLAQVVDAVATGLWLTIDKHYVLTHGEAANNEDGGIGTHRPYAWWNDSYGDGDTRGDLEYLGTPESPRYNPYATDGSRGGDVIRGKANWYRSKRNG